MTGVFYGLGVGPGDPELITLKAWRIISQAAVIAFPEANGNESTARMIGAPFIPPEAVLLPVVLPMKSERQPASEAYDAGASAIAAHLDQGRDVAFLCEGDPLFYGSFMYLFARISPAYETVVVPGVTSLTACAAAIGRPLAARNDVLKVLPALLPSDRLRREIDSSESIAIIKVGQHFERLHSVIEDLGLLDRAVLIEKATREDERITPLAEAGEGARPYFSTILIYKGGEAW